jgi:hypothetical protein
VTTEFFCLENDNHLNGKNLTDKMILELIYFDHFYFVIKHKLIFLGNSSSSGNILLELWFVQNLELHVEVYFRGTTLLPAPCQYIFSLMTVFVSNQAYFKHIHPCTEVMQGMSTMFLDQLPTFLMFSEKCILCWHEYV